MGTEGEREGKDGNVFLTYTFMFLIPIAQSYQIDSV